MRGVVVGGRWSSIIVNPDSIVLSGKTLSGGYGGFESSSTPGYRCVLSGAARTKHRGVAGPLQSLEIDEILESQNFLP